MSSSTKAGAGQGRFVSANPGARAAVGTARSLGAGPLKVHHPVWAVTGSGERQCYLGVTAKVEAIQAALAARIGRDDDAGSPDRARLHLGRFRRTENGNDRMRYS